VTRYITRYTIQLN